MLDGSDATSNNWTRYQREEDPPSNLSGLSGGWPSGFLRSTGAGRGTRSEGFPQALTVGLLSRWEGRGTYCVGYVPASTFWDTYR